MLFAFLRRFQSLKFVFGMVSIWIITYRDGFLSFVFKVFFLRWCPFGSSLRGVFTVLLGMVPFSKLFFGMVHLDHDLEYHFEDTLMHWVEVVAFENDLGSVSNCVIP